MRTVWIRIFGVALVWLADAGPADAGIVDTLSGYATDEPGWSGVLDGQLQASTGNTEIIRLSGSSRLQWRGGRQRWRAMAAFSRETNQGNEISRSSFAHLRHNLDLRAPWSTLLFVQSQENPFQRLRSRVLLGAGMRVEPWKEPTARVAVGLAHMIEFERVESSADRSTAQRLSTFLDVDLELRPGVDLQWLSFLQPKWGDLSDARAVSDATFEVELGKALALTAGLSFAYDSNPPGEVERTDLQTRVGMRLSI